jgi:hypothetical protein
MKAVLKTTLLKGTLMNEPAGNVPPVSNKLKMPEGVGPNGPFMDMTEAYVKSVVAIPAMLSAISDTLEDISDALGIFALYIEKKGLAEGTLSNDDLDEGADNGKDQTA